MKRAIAIADRAADLTLNLVLGLNVLFLVSFLGLAFFAALNH